jgi:hypothetical protein
MTADDRRRYVTDEAEAAGLTPEQVALAVAAAMSTGDFLDDDDFELMVEHVIQGAAEEDK